MTTKKLDLKQFNTFGHALPLLLDESTGRELVKSARKREDDIFKIDGKRRFHGAFTGGFSAGHWNTVGSEEGWAPKEFKSTRGDKFSGAKRQRPQDFMDDEDFGEFGIARKKITTVQDFAAPDEAMGADKRVKDSENVRFTVGLGLAAMGKISAGSEANWGNRLLRRLGWRDGQGVGARKRAKQAEVMGALGRRVGPTMPSGDELAAYQPITFAPKDCCPIKFSAKADNKGLGFVGECFSSAMATNSKALSVSIGGRKLNIAGQAFGVGALEDEDDDIYAQDSMANYSFDLKTEKEQRMLKEKERRDEKNKFVSQFALEGPKIEGGYHDVMDGFVRGRPRKKSAKIPMPSIPRDYTGVHTFEHDCQAAPIISINQEISRSIDEMSSKWKVAAPEYVKGGRKKVLSAQERAALLGEEAPKIKRADDGPTEINFQCKWRDRDKQDRYDRYCANVKSGKSEPYQGLAPDNFTKWETEKEKAEFERAATQKSAVTAIMMNRFKKAEFEDRETDVELPKTKYERKFQEKRDAVKMNFFGAMTHEVYDWYPAKLLCRRFDVPEPYPGSQQVGCPFLEMENAKTSADKAEETVQGIFGASTDEMKLFQPEDGNADGKAIPKTEPDASVPKIAGLASAQDLIKMEEDQFKTQREAVVNAPRKSLAEIKREMLTKANGKQDKPKFEINPRPAPGSAESKLPATSKTIVRETNFGQMSRPLSAQPSRFSSKPAPVGPPNPFAPVASDSSTVSARKMRLQQRQQKVTEQMATVSNDEKPPFDVFKSIFSDSESEEDEDKDDSESEEEETLTIHKTAIENKAEESAIPPPAQDSGGKLAWNRPGTRLGNDTKIEQNESAGSPIEPKVEKMETDDFDPPKITFIAKKYRKTTKQEIKTSDDEMDIGPALPSNFNIEPTQSFPDLTEKSATDAIEIDSDSDTNCWVASTAKKTKHKKHKKEKKKKHKKDKKR